MSISFTAINQKGNEEKKIDCKPNDKISQLKETLKFAKLNKYVFTKLEGQLIDENQLCSELKDQVIYVVADVAKRINIRIFPEEGDDDDQSEVVLQIKMSSTTHHLKESLLTKKWKSKPEDLKENNIEIKCGENILKDNDYIFCQNNDSDCFDAYIHKNLTNDKNDDKDDEGKKPTTEKRKSSRSFKPKIVEPPKNYYFINFDGKPFTLNLESNQTFSQINEMDELKSQDIAFVADDGDIIKLESKISDYKEAQKKDTPIHIQILYLIHVIYEDSEKAPKEYHHPFRSDQTVDDVLKSYAKVDKSRRELKYENTKIEPEIKLSKIDYRKGEPLLVIIHPSRYYFKIDETDEEFDLPLVDDLTIKEVIKIIQEKQNIKSDLEIYSGDAFDKELVNETETISSRFRESDKIIIKKVDPKYEITFNDETTTKVLDPSYTVKQLLENKKYKSTDERCKIAALSEGKILEEDQILFDLPSRQIKIELLDPLYLFQIEDNEPINVPIADGTKYDEAKNIIKDKFDELKDIDDERIIFEVENKEVDYDFKFSPDVPQDDPIIVKVIDPSYSWRVLENSDDRGVYTNFTFPTEFTIADAIKKIEDEFENKCSVSIIEKNNKKGKGIKIKKNVNIYEEYYGKYLHICVLKRDVKYAFSADGALDIKKRFNMKDKIGQIAKYLTYNAKKKSFQFSKEEMASSVSELSICFKYKNVDYKHNDEFKKLNYNPHEDDKIEIYLLPPSFPIYSLEDIINFKIDSHQSINDIKEKVNTFEHFILYDKFEPISDDKDHTFDDETVIDYFSYEVKIDFKTKDKGSFNIFINDKDITIDEIKMLAAAKVNEDKIVGPERVRLIYKSKEIKQKLFKEIEYVEGQFIDFYIQPKIINVKFNDGSESKKIIVDDFDDKTVADLQNSINNEKAYTLKFRGKELKNSQNLSTLHIPKEDYICAEISEERILEFEGNIINLDDYDLDDDKNLKSTLQNEIGIDVDNTEFLYKKRSYSLNEFKDLPKGANVVAQVKERNKYSNFEEDKYNNKFFPYQTIGDVRKHILSEKPGFPFSFTSDGKCLPDNKKLFQVKNQIAINWMKQNCYKKVLLIHKDLNKAKKERKVSEYFDTKITGKYLKTYLSSIITNHAFKLTYDGNEINDNDLICQFGEIINVTSSASSTKEKISEKICFLIKRKMMFSNYSERRKLSDYKKDLKLNEDRECLYFVKGKVFTDNENLSILRDEDKDDVQVLVYQIDEDLFDKSAKSAERFIRPRVELENITVKDFKEEDPIVVKYTTGLDTIGALKKKVSEKIGLESEKISLFIKTTDEANGKVLLNDDDDINMILSLIEEKEFYYTILNKTSVIKPNLMKKLREFCQKQKVDLTDDQIKDIFRKVNYNQDCYIATIEYIASKNS
ncbi:hypothetical protein M9Y10_002147 [Tritrichomonas musculus]|uniref:Ubiquitin-like domain-containing protein n=1 Tax=Tritrichomonas musculus TaxID=1915356 RepID=A0ABR2LBT5_9EUKA